MRFCCTYDLAVSSSRARLTPASLAQRSYGRSINSRSCCSTRIMRLSSSVTLKAAARSRFLLAEPGRLAPRGNIVTAQVQFHADLKELQRR